MSQGTQSSSNTVTWISLALTALTLVVTGINAWQTIRLTEVTKAREIAVQEMGQAITVLQSPADSAVAKELKDFAKLTLKRRVAELQDDDLSKQWKKLHDEQMKLTGQALAWKEIESGRCTKIPENYWREYSESPTPWILIPEGKGGVPVKEILHNYIDNKAQYAKLARRYQHLVDIINIMCRTSPAANIETGSISPPEGKSTAPK